MTLSQKETSFLQDLKSQEQVCVDKYNRYSANACDNQLKTLFSQIGKVEQGHLDTINQMLNGTIPSMSSGTSGSGNQQASNGTPLPRMPITPTMKQSKTTVSYVQTLLQQKNMFPTYTTPAFLSLPILPFEICLTIFKKKSSSTESRSMIIWQPMACINN